MDEFIYKYRKLFTNDKNATITLNENTMQLLTNGEIYLSDPKSFNDPFDCAINVSAKGTTQELKNYLLNAGMSSEEIGRKIKEKKQSELCQEIVDRANNVNFIGVFCLSSIWNNILLWSHYAQEHRGVCLGIKTYLMFNYKCIRFKRDQIPKYFESHDNRFFPLYPVIYSSKRPKQMNILRDLKNDVFKFVLTKSEDWEYENEFRIVMPYRKILKNPVYLASSQVCEVIFGLKTPDRVIKMVLERLIDKNDIKYYRVVNKSEYVLERESIDPQLYLDHIPSPSGYEIGK